MRGHQGPGLSSREDAATANEEPPPFTEIDLNVTQLGVAEATINLLHHQVGRKGFLIVVDARDDEDRLECILLNNRGMPRPVMINEQAEITRDFTCYHSKGPLL